MRVKKIERIIKEKIMIRGESFIVVDWIKRFKNEKRVGKRKPQVGYVGAVIIGGILGFW